MVLIPWISVILFLGFAGIAARQVGHWPLYSRPDPKQVEILGLRVGAFGEPLVYFMLLALLSCVATAGVLWHTTGQIVQSRSLVSPVASKALFYLALCWTGVLLLVVALHSNLNWLAD